jgi:hypothetical protein
MKRGRPLRRRFTLMGAALIIWIWTLAAVLLTLAVVFGRGVFAQFPEERCPRYSAAWLRLMGLSDISTVISSLSLRTAGNSSTTLESM